MVKNKLLIPITLLLLLSLSSCGYKAFFSILSPSSAEKKSDRQRVPQVEGMVYIPGGTFNMGSKYKKEESPVHTVHVDSFYLDEKEVTVYEYYRFCQATRRRMPKQPKWSREDHPVVNVTWADAQAYAKWNGKRLPTEAEWEFSARSTQPGVRYVGNRENIYGNSSGNIADESILRIKLRFPIKERYDDGYAYSAPAGSYPANIYGVYDLEGNVLEWCADWYEAGYYKKSPANNPVGPAKGTYKSIRGASWNRSGAYLRATYRTWYPSACAFDFLGFRCARDFEQPQK